MVPFRIRHSLKEPPTLVNHYSSQDHSTFQGIVYESFTDTVELRARLANVSLSKWNCLKVVYIGEPEALSSRESTRFLFC